MWIVGVVILAALAGAAVYWVSLAVTSGGRSEDDTAPASDRPASGFEASRPASAGAPAVAEPAGGAGRANVPTAGEPSADPVTAEPGTVAVVKEASRDDAPSDAVETAPGSPWERSSSYRLPKLPRRRRSFVWSEHPLPGAPPAADTPGNEDVVYVPIGADPPSRRSRVVGLLGMVALVLVSGALFAVAIWQIGHVVFQVLDRYFASG